MGGCEVPGSKKMWICSCNSYLNCEMKLLHKARLILRNRRQRKTYRSRSSEPQPGQQAHTWLSCRAPGGSSRRTVSPHPHLHPKPHLYPKPHPHSELGCIPTHPATTGLFTKVCPYLELPCLGVDSGVCVYIHTHTSIHNFTHRLPTRFWSL